MTDEKFLDKKMDRREFLKKAGIGGAGLALGLSGASAFFANQDSSTKGFDGDEDISFLVSTRLDYDSYAEGLLLVVQVFIQPIKEASSF
ncbi:MAG: twin-arginine translocation signal domain-containing protein [Streptococcus salivarius]